MAFPNPQSERSRLVFGDTPSQISVSLLEGQLSNLETLQHVKECCVRKVVHMKENTDLGHELILVEVTHRLDGVTFVQIDRCGGPAPRPIGSMASSPASVMSLADRDAEDTFSMPGSRTRASYTFDRYTKMLCERGCKLLRTATIQDSHMSLAQLFIMAKTLHEHNPIYSVLNAQCYWYAGMLVDMIQEAEEFGTVITAHDSSAGAGQCKSMPIMVVTHTEVVKVLQKYRYTWRKFYDNDGRTLTAEASETVTTQLHEALAKIDRLNEEKRQATENAQRARDELAAYTDSQVPTSENPFQKLRKRLHMHTH